MLFFYFVSTDTSSYAASGSTVGGEVQRHSTVENYERASRRTEKRTSLGRSHRCREGKSEKKNQLFFVLENVLAHVHLWRGSTQIEYSSQKIAQQV